MKKILNAFLIIIFSLSLSSCKNNKYYITKYDGGPIYINKDQNTEYLEMDGINIYYFYSSKCDGCDIYTSSILSLIENEKIKIMMVDIDSLNLSYNYPSIYIKNGAETLRIIDKINVLSKYERIIYEINKTLKIKNIYEIDSYDKCLELISENKTIYYRLDGCIDCLNFESRFFNDFLVGYKGEVYQYDLAKDDSGLEYQDLKDNLGLSNKYNELGYQYGKLPTLIGYKDGKVNEYRVIYNDSILYFMNPEEYMLVDSYYKDNPYINMKFKNMDQYYKKLIKFYSNKVKEILK